MIKKFLLAAFVLFIVSCGDDDNNGVESAPLRLLAEVAPENDIEIKEFLETHFYNYEEFKNPPVGFDYKIKIDTISGDNVGKIPLSDQVSTGTANVSSSEFALSEEENNIEHTYYYLEVREGTGVQPSVADSVYVRYKGLLLDNSPFDNGSEVIPVWFDLAVLQAPQSRLGGKSFRGFSLGCSNLKSGGAFVENPDGTFSVEGYGIGMFILPSGLANFNNVGTIPQYGPVIFTIDLFAVNPTDHDRDGIPSILEDVDGDGYLYNDNTDEESERNAGGGLTVNFVDRDDDDDGVLTRTEISDANGDIITPYPDSNNDGTPDYLDPDIQWNKSGDN